MGLKGKFGTLLALMGALWLGAAVPATAATQPAPAPATTAAKTAAAPRPAIWLLADEDTRIYLFGTIHILPPDLNWRSPEFDRVVEEVDELVIEVAEEPGEADAAVLAPLMMLTKPEPVLNRVSADRRETLSEMIESLGLTVDGFDHLQTWAAAMTIGVSAMVQAYAGPDGTTDDVPGVEDALRVDFRRSGRPISGVETGAQQLGFLSGLSNATQRALLEEMIDGYREGDPDAVAPDQEGWLRGDVSEIAEEMEAMPPELFDVLITRRNRAWTEWLIARLERPGALLFAVGAGHLAGRDSVQSMLAERGFAVTRIR